MLQSDRYRRSDRAAAIQSMGLLLERRKHQQHWNDGGGDISSIQHEWEDNVGIRDWTSSQNQTQLMDEENVHGGFLTKNGRSILKGGGNNLAGCGKKIRDLNNNNVGEAKPRQLEDGIGNVAGGKKGLRWKEDHHLCQQLAENDADGQEPPASFRCSVCGGRIWAGDQKSGAMGLEQQEGEELLVHWACFQCATCGLDLGNESQERVFKRDGRFYCHVHGPTALMAAAAGNNQQQKKKQQPQLQQLNGNGEAAVLGTGNGKAAAKREPEMREVEAESLRLAAKNEGGQQQQQQWWERNADQFNGNKKSSTTIRYYGPGEGGHGAAGHWTNGQRNHKSLTENRSTGNGTVSNGLAIKSNNNDSQPTNNKLATMTSAKILSQDNNNHNQISNHSSSHKRYTFLDKTDKADKHSADGGQQQKSWNWLGGGNGGKSAPLIIEKQQQQQQPKPGAAAANEDRCEHCGLELHGSFVLAKGRAWCPDHFCCANSACARTLLDSGFVEDPASRRNYCPKCYEVLLAPVCHKCSLPLTESCLNALGNKWHPDCFCCSHCRKPFGTLSFFVENGQPYCEDDWNQLFTTKCAQCHGPIKVGQKWLEALCGRSFHANCFKCTTCQTVLEGQTFFERDQRPYCRAHAIQQQQQQQNGRR